MSAIFGIFDLNGKAIDTTWIKSMQEDLSHRGPDGQGIFVENSLLLGYMLLQITPESVYDQSPFEEDNFVITANARLDEREALMDRLNITAEEREKTTDAILLLRSYRKWGKAFVKDIYGDFSFAIWDKQQKELFCARDQMGVKPFLYYFQDNRFVFSTELKSIVELPFVKTEIDQFYLRDRAIGIGDRPTTTTWKNIVRLSAANTLTVKGSGLIIEEYWKPVYKKNPQLKTAEQSATALREILQRVISDYTRVIGVVGVHLSGGLDSSSIACLAAKKMAAEDKRIVTASSVLHPDFNAPDIKDEMEYIETVLQQEKNIDATFVYNTNFEFLVNMEEIFNLQCAPVNNFYYVDQAIFQQFKSKAVRRVLSGYLGDMTASNSTIAPLPRLLLTGKLATFFKLSLSIKKKSEKGWLNFLKYNLIVPILPMFLIKIAYNLKGRKAPWSIDNLPLILNATEKKSLQKRKATYYRNNLKSQYSIAQNIRPKHSDFFEEDWDCGAANYQLEMTYPLLDRRVIELLLQIPVEHFYTDGLKRGLIRKAMEGILPEKISTRKNKKPYSPAYHYIVKKYLPEIKVMLNSKSFTINLEKILDREEMNIQLKKLVISKTSTNFHNYYFNILNISMWVAFVDYIMYKKENEFYETRNEKEME